MLFLFSVNLLPLALAVRPLADLGQTHDNREVKWPARSQKAVSFSQKAPAPQP